jgi:hypothetical protein
MIIEDQMDRGVGSLRAFFPSSPVRCCATYPVVAAWSGFLALIGAGAFALGMAIHNEAVAQQHASRPEEIYYCATGVEMPLYEPCKDRKDQRDIS